MRIAIYSRKSKFTGKGESIENQITLCKEYIAQHIPGIHDILVYEDEGFSGKNTDRPEFQSMLAAARTQKFDYIVCYRLDRISRSVSDFSALIEKLQDQKTAFVCIKEQFDTSNPMGKAMMYIASVFAQLERETIAERIRDNMYMLAKTGRWLGGNTPTGFRSEKEEFITVDQKIRSSCKLVPNPDEMRLIVFLFDKFLELQSVNGLASYLVQHGFKTRKGNDFLSVTVKNILLNPVYAVADETSSRYFQDKGAMICFTEEECDGVHGFMPYNRTEHKNKYQKRSEITEWMIAVGRHRGVINSGDWVKVQDILEGKRKKYAKSVRVPHFSPALLSGLLVCGHCGHFMRPHLHSNRRREDGKTPYYYICEYKEKTGRAACDMENANGERLDQAVYGALLSLENPRASLTDKLLLLRRKISGTQGGGGSGQDFLQAQLAERKSMIQHLVLALAKGEGDASAERIRMEINQLSAQCDALERQIQKRMGFSQNGEDEWREDAVFQEVKEYRGVLEGASAVKKRELLRAVVEKVIWDGKAGCIFLLGEQGERLLPFP